MDPDTGEPKDEIPTTALAQLREIGCSVTKPSEIAKQKVAGVMNKIQAGLDEANKKASSNAQKVRFEEITHHLPSHLHCPLMKSLGANQPSFSRFKGSLFWRLTSLYLEGSWVRCMTL
jgi:hypothetical protein